MKPASLPVRTRANRLAACGGRLHRADDPQAGRRDAHVTSRATASVTHRTAASCGETNGRTTPTRPCPGTIAFTTAASLCRLFLCHGRERQRRPLLTIASTIHATRAGRSPTNGSRSSGTRVSSQRHRRRVGRSLLARSESRRRRPMCLQSGVEPAAQLAPSSITPGSARPTAAPSTDRSGSDRSVRREPWPSMLVCAPSAGESPGGIAPPGARRTGREPLSSSGSHRPAVGAHAEPPVCEQAWLSSEDGGQEPACFGGVAAQPLVFPCRPIGRGIR